MRERFINKLKSKKHIHPHLQKVALLFLVVFVLILTGLSLVDFQNLNQNQKIANRTEITASPTPIIPTNIPKVSTAPVPTLPGATVVDSTGNWKTFTSAQYGFQVTFPAKGSYYDSTCKGNSSSCLREIECGNNIKQDPYDRSNTDIYVDMLMRIYIDPTAKTINDVIAEGNAYLKNNGKTATFNDFYTVVPILESNADEAVEFKRKPGASYTDLFDYNNAIFRKNNKLYYISSSDRFQNITQGNGCETPLGGWSNSTWDITKSFKFL